MKQGKAETMITFTNSQYVVKKIMEFDMNVVIQDIKSKDLYGE